jgi:hypothetical protein
LLLALGAPFPGQAQDLKLEAIGWQPAERTLELNVRNPNGASCSVESSEDLVTWEFVSGRNGSTSSFQVSDTLPARAQRRFYRARVTPETVSEVRPLGRGSIRSWVRFDRSGTPLGIGVTLTEAALTNLPSSGLELILSLTNAGTVAPFDHIGVNWRPQGHPPAGIYNRPHLDVHFYTVTVQERNAINLGAGGQRMYRPPDPDFLPPGYELSPGSGDARMGSHWWDLTSPELNGESFTTTLLYGYYDGELTFLEPMVTVAHLKTRPLTKATIQQPAAVARTGHYPLRYEVRHSADHSEYSIALEGLIFRERSITSGTRAFQPDAARSLSKARLAVSLPSEPWCGR